MKSGIATEICRNFLHLRLSQFRYDNPALMLLGPGLIRLGLVSYRKRSV